MTGNSDKRSNVYLVVGLGNPGPAYVKNRHNVGFMVLDNLAKDHFVNWKLSKGVYEHGEFSEKGLTLHLLKPATFMNLSGKAVTSFVSRKFIDLNNIIVVHDDMDLSFGKIRIKKGGGDGGHRGVRSIADSIRFKDFVRVRIGVGRPPAGISPEVYVLQDFSQPFEKKNIEQIIENGVFAVMTCISVGIEKTQQELGVKRLSVSDSDTD